MNNKSVFKWLFYNPLVLIILAAFLFRVINLNYNTPFLDEAIYIKLGEKVLEGHWQEESPFSWIGGMPLFYPSLSALFYNIGGLLGSRLLNVLLGTLSVYLLYGFTFKLHLSDISDNNEFIAGISAFLLAVMSIPVYLSRLAIYDMLSFTFFLAGLFFLLSGLADKKHGLWQKENFYFLSALSLFLSFLAKYTTLILFPLIAVWAIYKSLKQDRLSLNLTLKYFIFPLSLAIISYLVIYFPDLREFVINQIPDPQRHYSEIINEFYVFSLPVLPFALVGFFFLFLKAKGIAFFLLFGALTVPLAHLLTNNLDAAHQHVFLSLVFLLPSAGFLISNISKKNMAIRAGLSFIFLIMVFLYSFSQKKDLETSWPNSENAMTGLKSVVSTGDKILSSEGNVTDLALPEIPQEAITGPFEINYQGLSSYEGFRKAISDGYFTYILFNNGLTGDFADIVRRETVNKYSVIYDNQPFVIYQLNR